MSVQHVVDELGDSSDSVEPVLGIITNYLVSDTMQTCLTQNL